MNEQQIEQAARKLCELRGLDPDQLLGHGAKPDANGMVPAVLLRSPRWQLVAEQIKDFYQVAQAIDSVMHAGLQ